MIVDKNGAWKGNGRVLNLRNVREKTQKAKTTAWLLGQRENKN